MRAFLFILLAGLTAFAHAQLYKWTDSEGRVHYSDLPQLPSTPGVEKAKLPANVIQTDSMPYELLNISRKNPITLYVFGECGKPCASARTLLDKRGVPYAVKDGDTTHKAELQKLTGDNKMPILLVGDRVIRQGFQEYTWNKVLDEAGYPKTNPLAKFHKKPSAPAAVKTTPGLIPVNSTAP